MSVATLVAFVRLLEIAAMRAKQKRRSLPQPRLSSHIFRRKGRVQMFSPHRGEHLLSLTSPCKCHESYTTNHKERSQPWHSQISHPMQIENRYCGGGDHKHYCSQTENSRIHDLPYSLPSIDAQRSRGRAATPSHCRVRLCRLFAGSATRQQTFDMKRQVHFARPTRANLRADFVASEFCA